MTTTGWLDFLEAAPREAISPVEVARWQAEQADRRAAADEAEEAARAEDEAEARRFRYRTVGIEPGQVLAVVLRGVAEDEEYEAARAVMQRIERRRESRRRVAEYQGAQLAAASRASREPEGIEAANRLAARWRHRPREGAAALSPYAGRLTISACTATGKTWTRTRPSCFTMTRSSTCRSRQPSRPRRKTSTISARTPGVTPGSTEG